MGGKLERMPLDLQSFYMGDGRKSRNKGKPGTEWPIWYQCDACGQHADATIEDSAKGIFPDCCGELMRMLTDEEADVVMAGIRALAYKRERIEKARAEASNA